MIVVLAGGVGAARFLQGLVQVVPQERITVIVNTGDDRDFYGLHVSPDLDIVMYTLAGIVDEKNGWGIVTSLPTYIAPTCSVRERRSVTPPRTYANTSACDRASSP